MAAQKKKFFHGKIFLTNFEQNCLVLKLAKLAQNLLSTNQRACLAQSKNLLSTQQICLVLSKALHCTKQILSQICLALSKFALH